MKKPILAALGLAGACAVCCAIPLAIPLLGGSAAAGLASWLGVKLDLGTEVLVLLVVVSSAAAIGGTLAWMRRRRASARAVMPAMGGACSLDAGRSGCGCSPKSAPMA